MTDELKILLERAKTYTPTEEEKRAGLISFAWGNTHLHNPAITKAMIEEAYDILVSSSKEKIPIQGPDKDQDGQ